MKKAFAAHVAALVAFAAPAVAKQMTCDIDYPDIETVHLFVDAGGVGAVVEKWGGDQPGYDSGICTDGFCFKGEYQVDVDLEDMTYTVMSLNEGEVESLEAYELSCDGDG